MESSNPLGIRDYDYIMKRVRETNCPKSKLAKISRILTALDAISAESDIKSLGSGIHPLKGKYKGFWSLTVTGNYRIIFTFRPPDVFDVDYIDYH